MKIALSVDRRVSDGTDIVPLRAGSPTEGASTPEKHREYGAGFLENPVIMLL